MAPGVLLYRKSNVSIPSKQQAVPHLKQGAPPAAVAVCCKREKCKRILMITVLLYAIMLGYFILSQHPAFSSALIRSIFSLIIFPKVLSSSSTRFSAATDLSANTSKHMFFI